MSVIKLRGLPWSCTAEQIVKFLNGINIVNKSDPHLKNEPSGGSIPGGAAITTTTTSNDAATKPAVYLTTNAEGRPSGEAFVEVCSENDLNEALKLNNNLMGQRYIEIFRSDPQQLRQHTQESNTNATNWNDPVLRLRGLPYGCTKPDIETFFQGLVIAYDGIMMVIDFTGRFNGEAFVQFETISDAHKALERHKQKISNRYIEIFRSNSDEMSYYAENSNNQQNNNNNNNNGGGGGGNKANLSFSSRRDSRSDSSMFFNDNQGNQGGNNRFKPYARNGGNANGGNRNRGGGGGGGPAPLMGGGFGGNNNRGYNSNNNYNNNYNDNNFDDNNGGGDGNNYYNENNDYDDYGDNNNGGGDQGSGFVLKMRGLPFKVTEREVNEFFQPTRPTNISFLTDSKNRGRPSGECECEFDSEENLLEAMKCDKKYIGTRYIELFNLSDNNSRGGNNNRGGFNNGGNRRGGNNNSRGNSNSSNRGRPSNNNGGSSGTVSLDNFMSQSFNGTNGQKGNNNKTRTPPPPPPVPPPMPMQMGPMGMIPPHGMMMPGQQQPSMNNFMMTDMAQKMFTAAYTQFQQQQQLQYGQFNSG
jgi:heterogeneous nuclear ribonucleoprotein F/H